MNAVKPGLKQLKDPMFKKAKDEMLEYLRIHEGVSYQEIWMLGYFTGKRQEGQRIFNGMMMKNSKKKSVRNS